MTVPLARVVSKADPGCMRKIVPQRSMLCTRDPAYWDFAFYKFRSDCRRETQPSQAGNPAFKQTPPPPKPHLTLVRESPG